MRTNDAGGVGEGYTLMSACVDPDEKLTRCLAPSIPSTSSSVLEAGIVQLVRVTFRYRYAVYVRDACDLGRMGYVWVWVL